MALYFQTALVLACRQAWDGQRGGVWVIRNGVQGQIWENLSLPKLMTMPRYQWGWGYCQAATQSPPNKSAFCGLKARFSQGKAWLVRNRVLPSGKMALGISVEDPSIF